MKEVLDMIILCSVLCAWYRCYKRNKNKMSRFLLRHNVCIGYSLLAVPTRKEKDRDRQNAVWVNYPQRWRRTRQQDALWRRSSTAVMRMLMTMLLRLIAPQQLNPGSLTQLYWLCAPSIKDDYHDENLWNLTWQQWSTCCHLPRQGSSHYHSVFYFSAIL